MPSMNLFQQDKVSDLTREMLITLRDNELQAKYDHFETLDDYYYNRVADDKTQKYFPKLPAESQDEYDARIKIGIPFARFFIDKIVYFMSKTDNRYSWVPRAKDGDPSPEIEKLIDEANEINSEMIDRNDFHNKRRELMRNVLRYGYTLGKPKHIKFDKRGKEIAYDNIPKILGTIRWSEIEAYYVTPIYDKEFPEDIRAVVIMYDQDTNGSHVVTKREFDAGKDRMRIIELISADKYDCETGEKIDDGVWKVWINEIEQDQGYNGKNPYGILPVVVPHTVEYESFIERAVSLISDYNREISALANALDLMGFPMIYQEGGEEPTKIQIGPNRMLYAPSLDGNPVKLGVLSPDIKTDPYIEFFNRIERFISFAFGIPIETLDGLKEAKSGIQLKMLFASVIQLRKDIEAWMASAEEQIMFISMVMIEVRNNLNEKYTKVLKPISIWNDDIIPTDDQEELAADVLKEANGYISKVQNVIKHNDEIETAEQAEAFIAENATKTPAEEKLNSEKEKIREEVE